MPSIDENRTVFSDYDWSKAGDEWSESWGGTPALWHGSLMPRLSPFLPTATVLEIAPGYGRFTQYLKDLAERLVIVDLVPECIDACRQRFADAENIQFEVNDGKSLDFLEPGSVDLAFSFDSLVHVEHDVIGAYLKELGRVLADDGVIFFHHSNIAALTDPKTGELPFENKHWRASTMSGDRFRQQASAAGLTCVRQEIVNWGLPQLTDCFSLATRPGSRFAAAYERRENPAFMDEAERLRKTATFFATGAAG